MLRFLCKKCGQRLKVGDGDVGRKIRCPGCNYGTAVPPIKLNAKTYHFEYSVCDTVNSSSGSMNAAPGQAPGRGTPVPNSSETVLGIKLPGKPAPAKPAAAMQQPAKAATSPAPETSPDLPPGQQPPDTVPASAQPLRPGARLAPSPSDPARYQAALRPSRARTAALRLRPTARPVPPAPVQQTPVQPPAAESAAPVSSQPAPPQPVAASPTPVAVPAAPKPAVTKPPQLRPGALLAPTPKNIDRYRLAVEASKAKTRRLKEATAVEQADLVEAGDAVTEVQAADAAEIVEIVDVGDVVEGPDGRVSEETNQVLVSEAVDDGPSEARQESPASARPALPVTPEPVASELAPVEPVVEERPETPTRIERPEAPVLVRRPAAPRPSPRPDAPRPIINRQPDLSAPLRDDRVLAAGRSIDPVVKSLEAGGFAGAAEVPSPLSPTDLPDGFPAPGDSAAFDPAEALRMLADAVSGQSGVEPVVSVPVHEPEEADPAEAGSPSDQSLPVFESDDDEEERPPGRPAPAPSDPERYRAAIAASKARHP